MKGRKIIALLCAASLCCMSLNCVTPALASSSKSETRQAEKEAKKKAEKEAKKKAEKEAKKKAEAEAKKKAEKEAKKKAEAEAVAQVVETPVEEVSVEIPAEAPVEVPVEKPTEAPTPAPTEAPTQAPTEAPTQAPTEEPTKAPTQAPTEAPTQQPTQAPTEAPTQAPTEAPTQAPTEAPTQAPTEAPVAAVTEAPTQAPTEAPTQQPTQAPTEAPTQAPPEATEELPLEKPEDEGEDLPTETKGEVKLSNLKAGSDEVKPGRNVEFTYTVENAKLVTWKAVRSDGLKGGSGETTEDSFTWQPKKSGIYTVTVKATDGDITKTKKCTVTVRNGALSAKVKAPTGYAVVGESNMAYDLSVSGGCEPYTVNITVEYGDKTVYMSDELVDRVICPAAGYGKHYLYLEVIDATGAVATDKGLVRAATTERNEPLPLPRLNAKMTYAERLVAVAASQVGYHEVNENFILDADQNPQSWSYYGAWYGMPYEEWCVMFVMYCLNKAGMGGVLGVYANTNRWRVALGSNYIDDEDEYIPEAGDIIYFHHDRLSDDPNFPNHVGIVTDYDAEKDVVYTVEGNTGMAVKAKQYARDDACIVGYLSLREYMRRWDKAYRLRVDTARFEDRNRLMNRGKEIAIERE